MSVLLKAMLVAVGGASGALARWGVGEAALRYGHAAPLGTLAANLMGCFLMGMAKAAVDALDWGSPEIRILVMTGFIGAFTTFSTFEADTFALFRVEQRALAFGYLAISVLGGFASFLLGWFVVERIAQ